MNAFKEALLKAATGPTYWASASEITSMMADSALSEVDYLDLKTKLDPEGRNILVFYMMHEEREVRSCWFLKVRGTPEPFEVWIDIKIDTPGHEAFLKMREIEETPKHLN